MCGPGKAQKEAFDKMKTTQGILLNNLQNVFKTNTDILNNLVARLTPIVAAGPAQQGLSPQELSLRQGEAIDQIAAQGRAAAIATAARMPSITGGVPLASGAAAQLAAQQAQNQAEATSSALRDITTRGYELGRQNYWNAVQGLYTAPSSLQRPISEAGSITSDVNKDVYTASKDMRSGWGKIALGALGGALAPLTGGASLVPTLAGAAGGALSTATGRDISLPIGKPAATQGGGGSGSTQ